MRNLLILLATCMLLSCHSTDKTKSEISEPNAVVENILSRRTIRSYKPEQIQKEQLDTILHCAVNAPSSRNYQPWEIRVIQNPERLKSINKAFNEYALKQDPSNEKVKEENYSIFYNAPTLIIVAKDKNNLYGDFDCGLLTQNILLSAKSMNIGSVCLGILSRYLEEEDAKSLVSEFNIPESHEIKIVIGLGYTNENPKAKPRDTNKIQFIN